MKTLKYIAILAVGLILFNSCEQEDKLFDSGMSAVGFYGETASVLEVDKAGAGKDSVVVQILVTALTDAPSVSVTFEVDTTGIANPAVEGVDFETITEKTVTISEGWGYYPITIKAIDNDAYDTKGNKSFKLKIVSNTQGYDLASESVMTITITDDDHPLGWFFGDYAVALTATVNGSTNYSISIVGVDGETDKVKILGLCGPPYGPPAAEPYSLLASVSADFSTLTIDGGQEWESWAYGSATFTVYEDDNGDGEEVNQLAGAIDATSGVTVTFNQAFTFILGEPNAGVGISWAYNADDAANSTTAVFTKQ